MILLRRFLYAAAECVGHIATMIGNTVVALTVVPSLGYIVFTPWALMLSCVLLLAAIKLHVTTLNDKMFPWPGWQLVVTAIALCFEFYWISTLRFYKGF